MPGPAGQHRQRLDGHPVLSGRIIPGMEAPRGGPQVLLLSTGPRPALIDVIDDREDRVLSSLLLSYPRGFSDEKKERGSWPIAWRCGLRTGIAPEQWSMRRMSLVKVRRRRAGRPPLLLPQEIQAIIDGCATWDDTAGEWAGNLRDRLLFSLLAESGMRLGEVLGMAISDFVMGRGGTAYIEVVPRAGNPNLARVKMMRPRRIYVSADLERLFADYLTHLAGRAATTAVSWRRLSL